MAKNSITPNKFHDCHIFSLSSQGSIYSLCRLPNLNPYGRISLLAASLRKPVFLLEFNHGYKESLVPYSRELSFTYLPGIRYSFLLPIKCSFSDPIIMFRKCRDCVNYCILQAWVKQYCHSGCLYQGIKLYF